MLHIVHILLREGGGREGSREGEGREAGREGGRGHKDRVEHHWSWVT